MSKSLVLADLPNVARARLPERYLAAKGALEECERVDECRSWADKLEAMASYARQADDEELLNFAAKLKARAIRRCQELLKEFPVGWGGDRKSDQADGAVRLIAARKQTALEAGLSERQYRDTQAIGHLTDDEFEREVERPGRAPTVTELAERGRSKVRPLVELNGVDPGDFNRSLHGAAAIRHLYEKTRELAPSNLVRGLTEDHNEVLEHAAICIEWLAAVCEQIEGLR